MIESGKREPSLHTLLLLADGLGVRLGEVLNGLQEVKTVISEKSETE